MTPDGARRLREVRDHIVAHPEIFDMFTWCGTVCCIGGHIFARLQRELPDQFVTDDDVSEALGFGHRSVVAETNPLHDLFFNDLHISDPRHHAERINKFLWQYGYPPNEIAAESPQPDPVPVTSSTLGGAG